MKNNTTKTLAASLVLTLGILVLHSHADPGNVDPSFDPGSGINGLVRAMCVDNDGKIVIGGEFTVVEGLVRSQFARLNADGSGDVGFDRGTGANGIVHAVARQADGKLLVGGAFTMIGGVTRNRIARLNADGSLDTDFNPGTGANDLVLSIVLQSDGKVLIGGAFTTVNGATRYRIARLNTGGSLDNSFIPVVNSNVRGIAFQTNNSTILIGGDFTTVNSTTHNRIARLNLDGTLDTTSDPGTGANNIVYSVVLQPDGKMLIGGAFTTINGTSRNRIARLNADCSLDISFNPGTGANNTVRSVALQPDGKVLMGGDFTTTDGVPRSRIARLNADGSPDYTFDLGSGANSTVYSVVFQADDKVLIGGAFTMVNDFPRGYVARLNSNGSVDGDFIPDTSPNGTIRSVAVQCGRLLIGGEFTGVHGTSRNRIARLNADGSLDGSFNPGPGANNTVYAVVCQSDGKVIIGGDFTTIAGITRNRIARLNIDGSLDTIFNPGTGASSSVLTIALQADSRVLIGGVFGAINGATRYRIARLNADGSLDNDFVPNVNNYVRTIVVETDGHILIGGDFTTVNGTTRNRVARLNPDGTLDTTFDPGAGASSSVYSLALQRNGKVIIGGYFTTVNSVARNRIARLNFDGSFDPTFDPGTGANSYVYAVAVEWNDKVVIGGAFTTFNSASRNCICRLNVDGSLDGTFIVGAGANGTVYCVTLPVAGQVLAGGDFDTFAGYPRSFLVRLFGDPAPMPLLTIEPVGANVVLRWPTNSLAGFTLQSTTNLTCPTCPSRLGTDSVDVPVIVGTNYTITHAISGGCRFFRLGR